MDRRWFVLMLSLSGPVAALAAEPVGVDPAVASENEPPKIDPDVVRRLDEMGDFLRKQKSFAVKSQAETDEILLSGQKIQLSQTAEMKVRRPGHLRMDVSSDRKTRQFYFDGDEFTVYGPRNGYYATVDAPPTIHELADQIADEYGIDLPLADLFLWGTSDSPSANLTSAQYIGPAHIDGQLTDQYALRQEGLDWQIWIQRGDEPLPVKMLLTTTSEPEQPQHEVKLAWTLNEKFDDDVFTFTPPKGAHRIELAPVGGEPQASR